MDLREITNDMHQWLMNQVNAVTQRSDYAVVVTDECWNPFEGDFLIEHSHDDPGREEASA